MSQIYMITDINQQEYKQYIQVPIAKATQIDKLYNMYVKTVPHKTIKITKPFQCCANFARRTLGIT